MTRRTPLGLLAPLIVVILLATVGAVILGAWPPLVAVETGSMEPGIERGDLVMLTTPDRFPGAGITGSQTAAGEQQFGGDGDVIVFAEPGTDGPPILHRVAFEVNAGEDWTQRTDHQTGSCAFITHCPAPYDGYITYGDANDGYDQALGIAPVVHEDWVIAKAQLRVPYLGWIRLGYDALVAAVGPAAIAAVVAVGGIAGGLFVATVARVRYESQTGRE